ncbi:DNA polymerase III subunit delta [Vallitalea okinawensis]|uniref:DNA polymerase III subunit delta n=1 Tax=Vallitalea okinawensis TaxID=2078660 RepID=UPI000CFD17B7|nr:DNA polymerase III subunit delta [Vallitalea okinawensis]
MVGLKKQIKDSDFKNIYLFYGEENYLKNHYVEKIKEKVIHKDSELMNCEVIEKDVDEGYIINSLETLPFLSDRRLVIIKNSSYFGAKSTASDQLIKVIKDFPTQTIVIFIEDKIDRRNKFFKAVKSNGYVVEFNYLSENDLAKWVAIELKRLGKKAEYATLVHFIRTVGTNMDQIKMELDKLCAYKIEESMISIEDVNEIATKTIEFKIFQLVDAMGMKKCEEALIVYNNLLNSNEPPIRILIMLTRQFRLIYQIKTLLEEGYNINMAAKKIGVPPFVAKKCMTQGKSFKREVLEEALEECLFIDMAIKSGQIKDRLAVELLLTKYSQR